MPIGIISLLLGVLAPSLIANAQAPVRTEPGNAGLVAGRVVDSATGAPVGAVVVAMYIEGGGTLQAKVLTLADGRFLMRGVPKGTYRLYADKPGYIPGAFGRVAPEGVTLPLEVGAGQWVLDRELVIWKMSVMTGTVRDEAGIPVAGATVGAAYLQSSGRKPGTMTYSVWPSTQTTDDRGAFRFVVPPGRYTAMVLSPHLPDVEGQPGIMPTFHPSTVDPLTAIVYDIKAGEVRANVDVELVAGRTGRLAGRVVSPASLPKGTEVKLVTTYVDLMVSDTSVQVARSAVSASGTFAFPGVPQGNYLIRLATPTGAQGIWANQPITVADQFEQVDVFADAGRMVNGVMKFQSEPKPTAQELERTTVYLTAVEAPVALTMGKGTAGGTFSAGPSPVGRYVVSASIPGWVMTGARWRGQEVALAPFDLAGETIDEMEMTFARSSVTATGRVTVAEKGSIERALVVLFPVEHRSTLTAGINSRRRQSARVDGGGEYRFSDVPPGEYYLAVIDGAVGRNWTLPDSLERVATSATRISITAGTVLKTDLRWSGPR